MSFGYICLIKDDQTTCFYVDISEEHVSDDDPKYLCVIECRNPTVLKKKLIEIFDNVFGLIDEKEYFQGNEKDVLDTFIDSVKKHREEEEQEQEVDMYVKEEFPNYKEDEEYGGNKQLIKFHIGDTKMTISYISNKCIDNIEVGSYNHTDFHNAYLKKLVKNGIIEDDMIYDLKDKEFIKKVKKYMRKINIVSDISEFSVNSELCKYRKINMYFNNNLLINKNVYAYAEAIGKKVHCYKCDIWNQEYLDIGKTIKIMLLNGKCYDYNFVRKNIPYRLTIGKNQFYIENRDYESFGLDRHSVSFEVCDVVWLFNDGCPPWLSNDNSKNLKNIIKKYNDLTRDKTCLNLSSDTNKLLKIFDS